jgi:hypothetical protein
MYIAANSNKLLLQRGVILTESNTSTFGAQTREFAVPTKISTVISTTRQPWM